MPIILDPTDGVILDSITVLAYPHPSGDSCAIRRFVASMHRVGADAWQMLVREEVAGKLVEPPLGVFPGPKEAANASIQCKQDMLIVYYSGRVAGDLAGPFQAQVEHIPVPGIWPMPEAALQRVRNLARLLVKHFPDLAGDFTPYLK